LEQGFGQTVAAQLLVSEVDTGLSKVRRKFTLGRRYFSLSFVVAASQKAALSGFYFNTTLQGTLGFVWEEPRTGLDRTFYFDGVPVYSPQGDEWVAALKLSSLEGSI
jgi:hypothetical protein